MHFTLFVIRIRNSNVPINLLRERHCYPQKKEITRDVSLTFDVNFLIYRAFHNVLRDHKHL
jgi:hypothetical protein